MKLLVSAKGWWARPGCKGRVTGPPLWWETEGKSPKFFAFRVVNGFSSHTYPPPPPPPPPPLPSPPLPSPLPPAAWEWLVHVLVHCVRVVRVWAVVL
jgi:hypothetical protein